MQPSLLMNWEAIKSNPERQKRFLHWQNWVNSEKPSFSGCEFTSKFRLNRMLFQELSKEDSDAVLGRIGFNVGTRGFQLVLFLQTAHR
jgi:hypothetical protein